MAVSGRGGRGGSASGLMGIRSIMSYPIFISVIFSLLFLAALKLLFTSPSYPSSDPMYPDLHHIVLLDGDVEVQKELTDLWNIDLDGKVNGAVEIFFGSFHGYSQYLNFSHNFILEDLNPKACAWVYGMNIFGLDAWRREKCTEQYHYWQNLNEDHIMWQQGTLPALDYILLETKTFDKS